MNLKRLLCVLAALTLVLALAACQKTDANDTNDTVGTADTGDAGNANDTDGSADTGDAADPGDTSDTGDASDPDASDGEDAEIPDLTAFSQGLDEQGRFEGVRALDYVTLPDFDTVALPQFPQVTDRAVEDGDFVNIDYVGSVDGEEFDGGSTQGAGTDVIIGVTSYIDDFLEQIVGHTPGENFDIDVTFPEDYGAEDLAGKDAVFNITVNHIWEVTDEAAAALGFSGRDEMAMYVAYNGYSVEDVITDPGITVVLSAAQCQEVPDSVLETVRNQMKTQLDMQASQYGLDADTLVMYAYGASSADEYLGVQAPTQAKWYLIFQAVGERDNITATDEDIAEREYETFVEVYGKPYVMYNILQEKITAYIDETFAQRS